MTYRCPYCLFILGEKSPSLCPRCGKTMRTPAMHDSNQRVARKRKIENLWREVERQKAELQGPFAPDLWRNPKLYLGIIVVLIVIGGAIFKASDAAVKRTTEPNQLRAMRHVDVLAEALGRYHFHTGVYPTDAQGLIALVRDPFVVPGWNGPYINQLRDDPWGRPYVYEPPKTQNIPILYSCGPDMLPKTADDLQPEPMRFNPGTTWTNEWVSSEHRRPGIKILQTLPKP